MALTYERDQVAVVAWASPAAPVLHEVARGGPGYGLLIARDTIVWQQGDPSNDPVAKLSAVTLAGATRDLVNLTVDDGVFDFDGTRLLWSRRHCNRYEIVSRPLDEASAETTRFAACPLYVDRSSARFLRSHHLAVDAACPPLAPPRESDACRVTAALYVRGRRIATTRRRLKPARDGALVFALPATIWHARPSRLQLRVRTTTRGGTRSGVATLTPGGTSRTGD